MRMEVVGPTEPIDAARPGRRRADVVDQLSLDVDWQRTACFQRLDHAVVGRIAGCVDRAGDADVVADLELLYVFVRKGRAEEHLHVVESLDSH